MKTAEDIFDEESVKINTLFEESRKNWISFSKEELLKIARSYIFHAYEEGKKSKWIKVEDGLPDRIPNVNYSQVRCFVKMKENGDIKILVFNHEHKCWDSEDYDDYYCDIEAVTHWMIPELPEDK